MSKAYSRFLTGFFCLFLAGLFLLSVLIPDRKSSEVENRTLAQFPKFSLDAVLDGSFMEDIETYFSDQFPFRDQWTGMKARTEQLLGKTDFHDVYLCKPDMLIAKVPAPDESLVEKNLGYIERLQEKTSADVYIGMIPSAAEIWRDKLPDGAESWDQQAFLQQIGERFPKSVNFASVLQQHSQEDIFYRTDHHWTSLGAYYGYTAVLQALGLQDEVLAKESFSPEIVSQSFNGTLYSSSGIHWLPPDSIEFWVQDSGLQVFSWRSGSRQRDSLYHREYLSKKDQYSAFLGGNQPLCVLKNEAAGSQRKLLLVRDSYSDSLAPFLAQSFSEVHLVDLRYYRASVADYVAENGIDTVVVLYSIPNFITDVNLVFLGK